MIWHQRVCMGTGGKEELDDSSAQMGVSVHIRHLDDHRVEVREHRW